ncbi:MAG: hypothetical protein U0M06_00585 [Clostridia bacterium]|nr:hypothetical protein [Clostridia bacterium]
MMILSAAFSDIDFYMSTLTLEKPIGLASDEIKSEPLKVCFVCTGNTCRSPMAEAVLSDMGSARRLISSGADSNMQRREIIAASAGLSAVPGMPISQNAAEALRCAGIKPVPGKDYREHLAVQISTSDMLINDLIVGITSRHAVALMSAYPQFASKIVAMDEDIPDPFGGDLDDYKACLDKIYACIERMFFGNDRF